MDRTKVNRLFEIFSGVENANYQKLIENTINQIKTLIKQGDEMDITISYMAKPYVL